VLSKYSGKNQAAILIALFKEYNIYRNIGYFIADNAELNNTYIKEIL
jgi:hypothetical protein